MAGALTQWKHFLKVLATILWNITGLNRLCQELRSLCHVATCWPTFIQRFIIGGRLG